MTNTIIRKPSYRAPQFEWSPDTYQRFGKETYCTNHSYDQLPLFDDAALIELLDKYPRTRLQAFTMGTDPTRREEWKCVDISPESSGQDIWEAVKHGRLWLSLIKIEQFSQDYVDFIDGMYEHINQRCPHLGNAQSSHSVLLISSPGTQLYYHLDEAPNMLWNMRGHAHVWAYPPMDKRFVPQALLEDIYAGAIDEELPYEPWFDQHAKHVLMKPGDVMWWPHNAPHRLEYPDLNVAITTSYYSPLLQRRKLVQLFNRYILRNLGIKNRSMREEGVRATLKCLLYKVMAKVHIFQSQDSTANYVTNLLLDPNQPQGFRQLDYEVQAAFANLHEKENMA